MSSNDTGETNNDTPNEARFRDSILGKVLWIYTQSMGIVVPILILVLGYVVNFRVSIIIGSTLSLVSLGLGFIYYKVIDTTLDPRWPKVLDFTIPVAASVILLPTAFILPESFSRYWAGVISNAMIVLVIFFSLLIRRPLVRDYVPDYSRKDERVKKIWDHVCFYNTLTLGFLLMVLVITALIIALTKATGTIELILGKILPLCYPFFCSFVMWQVGPYLFRSKAEEVLGSPYRATYFNLWNDSPDEDDGRTTGDLSEPLLENNDEEENAEES